jgi:hypothetical protein
MTDSRLAFPGPLGLYSDAARRCSDIVNTHLVANRANAGKWVAIRLSDGGSDGVLYDTRPDAIRHQLHETQCAYVCIPPTGMPPKDAEAFLAFNRKLYDAGFRMPDPVQPNREIIMPTRIEDLRRQGII